MEACPMVGGDDSNSYAHNSSYQKGVVDMAKEMINKSIADKLEFDNLNLGSSNTFKIADLGCSVGPNTFIAIQNIIQSIQLKLNAENRKPLDFQVFFSDHTENDFNHLFRSLPHSHPYFSAGVPGSFHNRLFPKSSLHFVHSSYSVHWLSRVPKEVMNKESGAWNKGKIQCTGLVKEVAEAYANQYKSDMNSFLSARAEEVVGGGLMVLVLCTLPNGVAMSHVGAGMSFDLLGPCLMDLAKLGLISEEQVDSFNFPLYYAPIKELEEAIKENGYFSIEKMTPLEEPPFTIDHRVAAAQLRSVVEGLIVKHFGNEIIDELFDRFAEVFARHSHNLLAKENPRQINLFVLLKRK